MAEPLQLKAPSLRIRNLKGFPTLVCMSDEQAHDELVVNHLDSRHDIVHISAIPVQSPRVLRDFLYSRIVSDEDQSLVAHLFTMSGYRFNSPIEIYSPNDTRFSKPLISPRIQEGIDLIRKTHLIHIAGFETAKNAHLSRLNNRQTANLELEDAHKVYSTLAMHIPYLSVD